MRKPRFVVLAFIFSLGSTSIILFSYFLDHNSLSLIFAGISACGMVVLFSEEITAKYYGILWRLKRKKLIEVINE